MDLRRAVALHEEVDNVWSGASLCEGVASSRSTSPAPIHYVISDVNRESFVAKSQRHWFNFLSAHQELSMWEDVGFHLVLLES